MEKKNIYGPKFAYESLISEKEIESSKMIINYNFI
jgi:hypothetical protein